MEFTVKRRHIAEREYREGEVRVADERDVAHLVASGVLVKKEKPATATKVEPAARNKSAKGASI